MFAEKQKEETPQIARIFTDCRIAKPICGSGGDHPSAKTQATYIDAYLGKLCQLSTIPLGRAFPGRITKALLSEDDYKALDSMYKRQNKPFDDYDHLSRWECMEFGKAILAAQSPPAKKQ